ncbi:50S ribosomal protein L22 [Buchnera aphidicola]|uniref:Large ribosomal subunit protein uL22 n=1 Tax=Buchnera aphidicola (Stegophylla sp.) TaxID=2315800 RepID=A0A4D6YJ56_9GAMM|nr:50S ribosomal protein L22 [Buchnera aphidicola (Stegophylla sp.)]QCI26481.1 50S ribosomal protein L22 [Buchnera aphidicola (Stegophylla sp.)]
MEIVSKYRKAKSSAQKLRLIVNCIRGKKITHIMDFLNYHKKKSAFLVKKVLNSAIANAHHNFGINVNNLFIKEIYVDEGPMMKRIIPRAKGRSDHILKRTSHITVIVSNK